MSKSFDPQSHKQSFLQENKLFAEIEWNDESKSIGKLHEFDLQKNEFWLLQCPKDMDVTELQNQKLKMPGRSNIVNNEVISMELTGGKEQQAFAYCNRKGRYDLRLLPISGTIVVRDRIKAAENITTECAEKSCPPAKRVPLPSNMRVRHPLLGAQYDDRVKIDSSILERLQEADKASAKILKESLNKKNKHAKSRRHISAKDENLIPLLEIDGGNEDDAVEFIKEIKLKKKKSKRKHSEICDEAPKSPKKKINTKSIINKDVVAKDLQWLQNI